MRAGHLPGALTLLLLATAPVSAAAPAIRQDNSAAPPSEDQSSNARLLATVSQSSKSTTSVTTSSPTKDWTEPQFYFPSPSKSTVFKTAPTFHPEIFEVIHQIEDKSLLAPGYFFIDPVIPGVSGRGGVGPWNPQIYDQDGELVYFDENEGLHGQGSHVCDYRGRKGKHICVHRRSPHDLMAPSTKQLPLSSGIKYVLDETYTPVGLNFSTHYLGFGSNGHEYNMVDNGEAFLQVLDLMKMRDLSEFNGPEGGWIMDGCFQEVSVRLDVPLFSWCWTDHLPLWQTSLYFDPQPGLEQANATSWKAGNGSRKMAWDLVHFNSVDKNAEGDYLVSARHANMLVKIAGPSNPHGILPGAVLWKLGGDYSDFLMVNFKFSRQHATRFLSTSASEEEILILDNAWESTNKPTSDYSAGKIIRVNNVTMTAELVQEYRHPEGLLSSAKGNLQLLEPNGNALIGWGVLPSISEYSSNGTVLWHARFTGLTNRTQDTGLKRLDHSYRAYKHPWIGRPKWAPKLLVYSRSCVEPAPLVAYVSWNGATEATHWRFTSANSQNTQQTNLGTWPKVGFETEVQLLDGMHSQDADQDFRARVLVEALDVNGAVLSRVWAATFVPSPEIRHRCDDRGCAPDRFRYHLEHSMAAACNPGHPDWVSPETQRHGTPMEYANGEAHPVVPDPPATHPEITSSEPQSAATEPEDSPKVQEPGLPPNIPEHTAHATAAEPHVEAEESGFLEQAKELELFVYGCLLLALVAIEAANFLYSFVVTGVMGSQKSWLYDIEGVSGYGYAKRNF